MPTRGDPGATDEPLVLRSKVAASAAGLPLLDYLLQRFRYQDRNAWLAEIAAGRLRLAGRLATATTRLAAGDLLEYHKVHHEPWVDTGFHVLHTAADHLVVDKPAHLPMHADGPFVRHTLIHLLQCSGFPEARLVHRLDRETSGLVVVARQSGARAAFERQFAGGTVTKAYVAVVDGLAAGDFTVDAPIGRARHSAIALRRSAAADALAPQSACTRFVVLARGPGRTLLRCEPTTGRTHQIRVHLEHVGLPITGDKLYGRPDADYLEFVARCKQGGDGRDGPPERPDRQLLHATSLAFDEPAGGRRVQYDSPAPACFRDWLQQPRAAR